MRFVLGGPVADVGAHYWCPADDGRWDVVDESGRLVPFAEAQRMRGRRIGPDGVGRHPLARRIIGCVGVR
jgi:hypothetical protein